LVWWTKSLHERYYSPIMVSDRIQRQIDRLLDEAEEASSKQDWETVQARARHVLTFEPENPDGLAFLAAAGRALGVSPDSAPPTPQAKTTPTEHQAPAATAPEAERRQLTVMFCDLQGSTTLSQQLDPEVLRDVIRSYQEVCAGAVGRFEGHIAKYLGDGLLIYFGYPQAHEDDPQRAVRAGLAILEDMAGLNSRLKAEKDLELTVRIGVHTGLVVAGEMGGGDTVETLAIVGETPNIAARLQEAAEPNSVVISEITASLVQGFFLSETLGFHELKGISEPMKLFRVLSESGAQTRFDVAASTQLTPLVGREQELGLLLDRWEQVEEGLGQVVLLSGEAGIGKSRLLQTLNERLAGQPHVRQLYRCSPYFQNSALHPMIEFLERWLGFQRQDTHEEKLTKLERALEQYSVTLDEAVPLLASLLSLPLNGRYPSLQMSPEGQRQRTREILVDLLMETARGQPVLFVVEDLHWADPSLLDFLGLLVDQAPTSHVLALFSFRPEFSPPWGSRAFVTSILLNRLTRRLTGDMVGRLTGGKFLPEEVLSQVTTKSDGVPLFVEELTRMVLESDLLKEVGDHYELTGPLAPLAIPSTLQDSLTARLDRLAEVREVAQLGAVLGREFSYDLMQAVSPLDEETLRSHLQKLVSAEFLNQRGLSAESTYIFRHALIQDAAYESLLMSRRQQYHQQVASVLEERFADTVETQPELLAHHYSEAGLIDQAVPYWQSAGERALATFAHEEALSHFQRGLEAKEGQEMDAAKAALLFGLGCAQAATLERHQFNEALDSMTSAFDYYEEALDVDRAVAIAEYPIPLMPGQSAGVARLRSRALRLVPPDSLAAGRLFSHHGRLVGSEEGDYGRADEAFASALAIAEREGNVSLEMRVLADASYVDRCRFHYQDSLDKALRATELAQRTNDLPTEVDAHYWATIAQCTLGRLEGFREHAEGTLQAAEKLRDRSWLSLAIWLRHLVPLLMGDWPTARHYSDRGLAIAPGESRHLWTRALMEYQVGDSVQGQVYLKRLLEVVQLAPPGATSEYSGVAFVIPMIARITGVSERFEIAEKAGHTLLSAPVLIPVFEFNTRTGLALLAVIRGDCAAAEEQYAVLGSMPDIMLVVGGIANDRLLGLLAHTMGNFDLAVKHFEDALSFCRKAGYRPELAWTCCDYADTLFQREAEGDRAKANALLDESLAISSELGMRPLMERVLSRREILGA